jgi:hypothetical protein
MSRIQYSIAGADNGQSFVTLFADGVLSPPIADDHPNYEAIVAACEASRRGEDIDAAEVVALFDIAQTVSEKFQRLTERVTVEHGTICLDGDPVHGTLQDQILDFVTAGEDFGPLVNFFEKLVTNPLGDVREGIFDWIVGQKANGALTITPGGDLLGYKACEKHTRDDGTVVYRPSRASGAGGDRVNGVEVKAGEYIEQQPGDTVEMPRSKVLHAPSRACGDGLHIGTYGYASTFLGDRGHVLLVQFSPRDVVSVPDSNSSRKLRVCRYTVIAEVDAPLDVPLYVTDEADVPTAPDLILDGPLTEGERVVDEDGDEGVLVADDESDTGLALQYDDTDYSTVGLDEGDVTEDGLAVSRVHGKGGPTSQDAKGRGRNAAQDDKGRFSAGRPGSQRDSKGRFCG